MSQESGVCSRESEKKNHSGRETGRITEDFANLLYINVYFVDAEYCFVKQIQYVLQNIRKYSRCVPFI
jgi:hypothetical protein